MAIISQKIERVDEIPLILHWLKILRVTEIIDAIWHPHGNWKGLSYGQLAVLFVTYVINSLTHKFSGMEKWVMEHKTVLEKSTNWKIGEKDATDDRLGLMVGELGSEIEKAIEFKEKSGQHMIQAFELPTEIARYDTTSLNVHHNPEKTQEGILSFGHSKDKRPDLLQFKQGLGVLDPAGIPIFSETIAGKEADDPLYVPAWKKMSKIMGRTDFLYVTDSKGSGSKTRATIDFERGYYLCPLPMTGKVPEELKKLVLNPPKEAETIKLENVVDKKGNPIVVGKGFVVKKNMETELGERKHNWEERCLIIRSNAHAERKKPAFIKRLQKAENTLQKLKASSEETVDNFKERVNRIIKKHYVEGTLAISVTETIVKKKHYTKRGRPGPKTPFEMIEIRKLGLEIKRLQAVIDERNTLAGWRIYVTNTSEEQMTLEQSVRYYRDEWLVEHSFHRLKKGKLPVLPLFLRIRERIRGLMLLLTVAIQVLTLMEFVIRRELAQQQQTLAGLVPGNQKIKTSRPTSS